MAIAKNQQRLYGEFEEVLEEFEEITTDDEMAEIFDDELYLVDSLQRAVDEYDRVEAAYRRGDLFEKRRRMMADWSSFCDMPVADGKVIALVGA